MRRLVVAVLVAVCSGLVVSGIAVALNEPGEDSSGGIPPVVVAGNPTCSGYAGESTVKFDPPVDGEQAGITIDVHGKYVDWSADDHEVDAVHVVIVKGGPNANIYIYPSGAWSDEDLHAPVNPNNDKYFGLSHVTFCFDPKD
jgi:hypothetical protein